MSDNGFIQHPRKLTGNYYFKPSLFGLILLVEETIIYSAQEESTIFRRGNYEDIFELGLITSTIGKPT